MKTTTMRTRTKRRTPPTASTANDHSTNSTTGPDVDVTLSNDAVIVLGDTPDDHRVYHHASQDPRSRLRTLLIVEDDDVDAEHISRLVRRMSGPEWHIIRARSLVETLSLLDDHEPMVALVDLNLPDAWHDDVVRAIVECSPECSVIVQTGSDDESGAQDMLELGAQDFLTKGSLTLDTLERAINHAMARHETLATLVRTWKQLAEANAELDEFAHMVAHDLRAPVRTARMLGDRMLAECDDTNEFVNELGTRLDETLGRIDGLIISMLEYSGLRRDGSKLSAIPLAELVRSVVDSVDADLLEASGTIEIAIDDDISVWADADLLSRAFINLITNSIKYRRPDCKLQIDVTALIIEGNAQIRVRDNGIGIPAADRQRVFKLLERLHPAGTPGLGFGLAICRRILANFDADINVEDVEGAGTTMAISIPACQQATVNL